MNLLVDPIQQRFQPAFRTTDLTSKEMDRICDGIEVRNPIAVSNFIRCLREFSIHLSQVR
jgi:hypothetical protein